MNLFSENKAAVKPDVSFPHRTIYEKLASAFTEEQAVLYNQRVEEISPNIRYCAYNIGEQGLSRALTSGLVLVHLREPREFI